MGGLPDSGGLGGDLQVGHQCAVIEDKQLQVGALEDLGGQLGRLHIRVVVILAHQAMEKGRAAAQWMMAQMVHQVCHDHPCRQGNQLHVPTPLFWWKNEGRRIKIVRPCLKENTLYTCSMVKVTDGFRIKQHMGLFYNMSNADFANHISKAPHLCVDMLSSLLALFIHSQISFMITNRATLFISHNSLASTPKVASNHERQL